MQAHPFLYRKRRKSKREIRKVDSSGHCTAVAAGGGGGGWLSKSRLIKSVGFFNREFSLKIRNDAIGIIRGKMIQGKKPEAKNLMALSL